MGDWFGLVQEKISSICPQQLLTIVQIPYVMEVLLMAHLSKQVRFMTFLLYGDGVALRMPSPTFVFSKPIRINSGTMSLCWLNVFNIVLPVLLCEQLQKIQEDVSSLSWIE